MNAVSFYLEYTRNYFFEGLFQQTLDAQTENAITTIPYQTIAVSLLVVSVGSYVIKKAANLLYPSPDTSERFWKDVEANQKPPLLGGITLTLQKELFSFQGELSTSTNQRSRMVIE